MNNEFSVEMIAQEDLDALERSGRKLPLELSPREAWALLQALQGATKNLALPIDIIGYARNLGLGIEGRLCQTPAMQEAAAKGWERWPLPPPEEPERPSLTYNKRNEPEPEQPKPKRKRYS